ncbi:helix-turn-helix domain-containing protein [Kinneretia aquatilis]|uniref:helix-turn-helix domain-containing protein n=1 Tax=Kinneretia aquatilis TaxID=2070761 RepID=UPI0013FE141C|nr:helix-turn-helix domain-containing protein [Paucibacter aquatile]
MADLLADIGNPSAHEIAKKLGVSRRTADRWRTEKAPRIARLALWWLSREGHSVWDCEMATRTQMAIQTNEALWREVRQLREQIALMTRNTTAPLGRTHPANDRTALG